MKFLMYSVAGEGAQILNTIKLEGNTVGLYIKDKIYKSAFDGILPKVDNPDSFIDKDTVIIFDLSGNGDVADRYRKSGHIVYGASKFADNLEENRRFGFQMMQKAGIKTPKTKTFKKFKDGLEYVRQSNDRLVFKPSGQMPCKLTYVPSKKGGKDELVTYMQFVEARFGKDIDDFVLQEFIEGVVVSTESFCNSHGFLSPANHTVEVKKAMNDELGPSTGCSGNITWACEYDQLWVEGVGKIEKICKENGLVGQIDLNAVLTESGDVYGLEWTPRFGYDATPLFLTLVNTELGKFFSDIARNEFFEIDCEESYAGSVRVSIPPYPAEPQAGIDTEEVSPNIGVPILGWEECVNDCYFYEVMMKDGQLVHSGGTGVVLIACGIDESCVDSLTIPYEICEELVIPDKQYRTDLNTVLPEMVEKVIDAS